MESRQLNIQVWRQLAVSIKVEGLEEPTEGSLGQSDALCIDGKCPLLPKMAATSHMGLLGV